jgi:BirA family transcriptional regulator, biotin operon repressor / biotin---[acetyl-CoA-carboxylase] ligase
MSTYTLLEFSSLESTNDFIKENHAYFPHMTFIRADHQTKGRGQFDRIWESEDSKNLLFSVLVKKINIDQRKKIKDWIIENIQQILLGYKLPTLYKEPNDLYIENKKICGVLIEGELDDFEYDFVVIGVGLNVNQIEFKEQNAISMKYLLNQDVSIKTLFDQVVTRLMQTYYRYIV